MLIERNEGTAARRRIPVRLFASDGTSPDTGATSDAVIMGVNSAGTITLASSLAAVHAANGMYYIELSQSDCSVLGVHPLYHTVGDFPQHVANVEIVNFNPYSSQSNIPLVATVTTLTGHTAQTGDSYAIVNSGTFGNAQLVRSTTPANTLDVSAGGEAGIDWANIGGAATAQNLSGTTVKGLTDTSLMTIAGVTNIATDLAAVQADTDDIQTRLPAALVGGRMDADIGAISTDAAAANNLEAAFDGTGYNSNLTVFVKDSVATIAGVTNIATDVAAVQADTDDIQTRLPAALVGGRIDANMGAVSADAAAADNLEAAFDGTGYDSGLTVFVKNSIATIAGVTNIATDIAAVQADTDDIQTRLPAALVGGRIDANMGAVSADATAADNLESAFDGTGYNSNITVFMKDSIATIAGVTNTATLIGALNDIDGSAVTLAPGPHSGATIPGVTNLSGIAAGTIQAASFAASAIDAAALATDAVNEIADGFLDRNMATGADSGSSAVRTPRDALRALRNRVASDTTQIYVYEEDDTTVKWTASITTVESTNDHISGADPNA